MKTCKGCKHWQGTDGAYAGVCAKAILVRPTFDQVAEGCAGYDGKAAPPPNYVRVGGGPPRYKKGRCI